MDTLERTATFRHTTLRLDTEHATQFIDLTDELEALVRETDLHTGVVNVQTLHTTTAIIVNEHEPLLLTDLKALFERLAPEDARYRHDDVSLRSVNCVLGERPNGHSHCRAVLLAASASLNVAGGRLQLGRWQRVFFVELDGPRSRDISVVLAGSTEA